MGTEVPGGSAVSNLLQDDEERRATLLGPVHGACCLPSWTTVHFSAFDPTA